MRDMRTTIDLSDELLRKAKAVSALEGLTLKELIARAVTREIESYSFSVNPNRVNLPIVDSSRPGSVKVTSDMIAKLLEAEDLRVSS